MKGILNIHRGAINNVGSVVRGLVPDRTNVLVVSGPHVWPLYGDVISDQLDCLAHFEVRIITENSIEQAFEIAKTIMNTGYGIVVGVGGGRVIDVGKCSSYIAKVPFVSVPTTMANDGIASPIASLRNENGRHRSLGCQTPNAILLDLDLIEKGPVALIKAGIGDTISNYTALLDWELAERRGKDVVDYYARLMSKTAFESLLNSRFNSIEPDFLRQLADSLVLSGLATQQAGSSRPVSGSEHLFSHALDEKGSSYNLHGIQTALGTVASLMLRETDYNHILGYLRRFDVDINPSRLGISEDEFVECFQLAPSMRPNRYTYLNEADLSTANLKAVYAQLEEVTR